MNLRKTILCVVCSFCFSIPVTVQSAILGFHFTGNIMVADQSGGILSNGEDINGFPIPLTPISAELNYDTVTGIGGSTMSIVMSDGFWDQPATFHDITLQHDAGTNTINGNILVDWSGNADMQMHISWDATGFLNAIGIGLQVGDTISGTNLIRDGVTIANVGSADPYSDTLMLNSPLSGYYTSEGPAPLAATSSSLGLGYDINGEYVGKSVV